MPTETQTIIADQNDRFRRGDATIPGQIVATQGVQGLLAEAGQAMPAIAGVVQTFDVFTEDNDPHGEHDFGQFEFGGQSCFWKIDLYDPKYEFGSEAPADLAKTCRVLTIMLATEY